MRLRKQKPNRQSYLSKKYAFLVLTIFMHCSLPSMAYGYKDKSDCLRINSVNKPITTMLEAICDGITYPVPKSPSAIKHEAEMNILQEKALKNYQNFEQFKQTPEYKKIQEIKAARAERERRIKREEEEQEKKRKERKEAELNALSRCITYWTQDTGERIACNRICTFGSYKSSRYCDIYRERYQMR